MYKLDHDKYSDENIKERILNNNFISLKSFAPARCDYHPEIKRRKLKGFKALYFKYMYLLGILPKNEPRRKTHPSLKEDLRYLDEISKQTDYIETHNIESMDDLNLRISELETKLKELSKARSTLYYQKKHCADPKQINAIDQNRKALSHQIQELRKELKTCVNIKERSSTLEGKINSIENTEVKKGERNNVR